MLAATQSSDAHSLEVLCNEWQTFNLDALRETLDAQASEIADKQDLSIDTRKQLADSTQKFRKLSPELKLKSFGALLKAYQEEVDRLTRRGAFAEKAFLSLYKSLSEIPDPLPGLKRALEGSQQSGRLVEQELEIKKLQKELAEFHKEFQEIQNQEVTIRRLEERIREYERRMEDLVEEKVKAREQVLREEHAKEIVTVQERELDLQRQLATLSEELRRAQQANEDTQAQLFDLKTKHDDEGAALQLQLDMLANENERATATILALEQERNKLKERVQNEEHLSFGPPTSNVDLELAVAQKDIEISQMQERIQELETTIALNFQRSKAQVSALEQHISSQKSEIENLEKRVRAAEAQHRDGDIGKPLYEAETNIGMLSAESALRDRNRRLETEHVHMKALVEQQTNELQAARQNLQEANERSAKLSQLIAKLEEDLAATNGASSSETVKVEGRNSDEFSMVEIVCSQRDRFKGRVLELEADARKLRNQLAELQGEMEALRADNVKLYEKMRYLQSYNQFRREAKDRDPEAGLLSEEPYEVKYKKMYEESVNPFVLFNRKEKQDRYKELNAAEKVTLKTGRFFLANKFSRTFIFFYALALHLLVFTTLYKLASTPTATAVMGTGQ